MNNMKIKNILTYLLFVIMTTVSNAQIKTIYTNINYIDLLKGNTSKNAIVAVYKNGLVTPITAMPKKESKIKIIDATGKYMMPSLYDMHVHWPSILTNEYFTTCSQAGITNVRVMKAEPTTIKAMSSFKNIEFTVGYPYNDEYTLKNATTFIDSIKKEGYHFIKFFSVKNEADFKAIAIAAQKAQLKICGHALANVKMDTAFYYGYKSVEHVGYLDKLKDDALDSAIQKFKQYNVAVCPTLDWMLVAYGAISKATLIDRNKNTNINTILTNHWDTLYKSPQQNFGENAAQYAEFANKNIAKKLLILKKLKEAGVKIIIGSDAEEAYQAPGYSLIEEMKHIAKAGFTNMEVLQMATINAEKYWHDNNKKNIKKTFIIVDKNPLDDLNNLYNSAFIK